MEEPRKGKNCIICVPTGSEKTIVTVMLIEVIRNLYELFLMIWILLKITGRLLKTIDARSRLKNIMAETL